MSLLNSRYMAIAAMANLAGQEKLASREKTSIKRAGGCCIKCRRWILGDEKNRCHCNDKDKK